MNNAQFTKVLFMISGLALVEEVREMIADGFEIVSVVQISMMTEPNMACDWLIIAKQIVNPIIKA